MPTSPSPHPGADPFAALAALHNRLRRRQGEILESSGVTVQQYAVLRILYDAGDPGLPTLTIAAQLPEADPGITRLIDRLEQKGMIRRERGVDRRKVYCQLTTEGTTLVERLRAEVQAFESSTFGCLNANEVNVLMHLVRRVLGRVQ